MGPRGIRLSESDEIDVMPEENRDLPGVVGTRIDIAGQQLGELQGMAVVDHRSFAQQLGEPVLVGSTATDCPVSITTKLLDATDAVGQEDKLVAADASSRVRVAWIDQTGPWPLTIPIGDPLVVSNTHTVYGQNPGWRHAGDVVTDLSFDGDRFLHDIRGGGTDIGDLLGGVEDAAGHDEDGDQDSHGDDHLRQREASSWILD